LGCVLNGGLVQKSRRGRILDFSSYHFHLYSILKIRVDFLVSFHLLWFSPSHKEIFLIKPFHINKMSNTMMIFGETCGLN